MFKIILYGIIAFGFVLGYVKYIENKGIFYPSRKIESSPSDIKLPFEDIYVSTKDGLKIHGWFISFDNARYTLLFLHGNAGNVGHRLDKINLLYNLGLNIFIIDYRGYGKSEGIPSENGFYADARAAYDYLLNERRISPDGIILYGESIGSAVVVDLAAKTRVKAMILEGAFSCGRDMAKRIYPFLPAFLFSDRFDSQGKIKGINAAKLFIHSKVDEIVPLGLARRLYNLACPPKQFAEINGSHNDAFLVSREKFLSSINSFIESL